MRLILSRKGYDSSTGGCPSPIFPDGELCSLPIPSSDDLRLEEVRRKGRNLGDVASQLSGDTHRATSGTHLDPDLDAGARPRLGGWRPCFGQTLAAQTHLENGSVGSGDLFLFFGWFREVETVDGRWRFRSGAPDIHCIFGWLQVGSICRLDRRDEPPSWASEHPHVRNADLYHSVRSHNTLYVASERLKLPGVAGPLPGGGVFSGYAPGLRLTAPGSSTRSLWRLPTCFEPRPGAPPLSYHAGPKRWSLDGDAVLLRTAGRGQEFVLDCDSYPGVYDWLAGVFRAAGQNLTRLAAWRTSVGRGALSSRFVARTE